MPTSLIYDIGYYGTVKIADVNILATGGSVSLQYSPIMSTGVWGAYWKNATQKMAYAPNYIALSANASFQLTSGITNTIRQFAFLQRNQAKKVTIYPNGTAGYSGNGFCISFSLSTSQDSLVSGDIGIKSGDVSSSTVSYQTNTQQTTTGSGTINSMIPTYKSVYPYWASAVFLHDLSNSTQRVVPSAISSELIKDITDWSASYSSDLILAACCTGQKSLIAADYCALGTMQAQGSFTMVRIGKYFDPEGIQGHNQCTISMSDANGSNKQQIVYGALIWTSASTDVQTGSSLIQSSFGFSALGNQTQAPMDFLAGT